MGIHMFYDKNREERLSDMLFQTPTSEYRGAPFWAWNGRLQEETLMEQIEVMKRMGMGGFFMHVRTGMDSPYLDGEFMGYVRACVEKARQEHMYAWLYDEDRWPSGSAGGKVTRDCPEYAAKSLLITPRPYGEKEEGVSGAEPQISRPGMGRGGVRQENGELLAVFDIALGQDGTLERYRRIAAAEEAEGKKWYVYLEHATADPWFNDAAYVDTLSYEAVASFLEITYEAYARVLGKDFGGVAPAVFTDEPQFNAKTTLGFAREEKDVFLPWTSGLDGSFREAYGYELLPFLPELLWELPKGRISVHRYRYHNHIADRFAHAYCGQIGDWCRSHGIRFTGHVLGEGTLEEQTQALGECMRCYKAFDIPGMDNLCDRREFTTAKQVQSIVRQRGAEGMLSELYGVTGWDYDFRGYKLQGDWQAALGVTVRVPHLFWMTMKGEAKRDFPPSIGCQSPWYEEFSMIEDHFARVNTAMTRGKAIVRIGVIHPIESYWLHFGPAEQTAAAREELEGRFQSLTKCLLLHGLDFDFISENELPGLCPVGGNPLRVGGMAYDVIVISGCETLRSTTVERLRSFRQQGGELLLVGDPPDYVDAEPSPAGRELFAGARRTAAAESAIVESLGRYRFLEVRRPDGGEEASLLHQLREDGDCRWLFIANGLKPEGQDADEGKALRFLLRGEYNINIYDTYDGQIRPLQARYEDGNTVWEQVWYIHDSLLLRLTERREKAARPAHDGTAGEEVAQAAAGRTAGKEAARPANGIAAGNRQPLIGAADLAAEAFRPAVHFGTVEYRLTEPNMYLLDMAEYAIDGGPWQPVEEFLRLDNLARSECGLPPRRREVTQPYLLPEEKPVHRISLRMVIESDIDVKDCRLGLEDSEETVIRFNGAAVSARPEGWYVDRSIATVKLPPVRKGANLLEITVPLGRRTNLEYMYLLGEFGVLVSGTAKRIMALPGRLGFGDITAQGLPFYTGCVDYSFAVETGEGAEIAVPRYRGGLVKVFLDGAEQGNIAFSPYRLRLNAAPGRHMVTLRLYGTRQNGFGQLHHTPGVWFYQSPNSWRSTGRLWCYEYQLGEAGILKSPELYGACFAGSRKEAPAAPGKESV